MSRLLSVHIEGIKGLRVQSFSFDEVTSLLGNNGSGKTHIIEAIHRSAGGEIPYRNEIQKEPFSLRILYEHQDLQYEYTFIKQPTSKEFYVQGRKLSGVKYMEHLPFRTVLFSPFDMNLLYFAPAIRRDSLDSILRRTFPQFPQVKRQYDDILRQRNALLKQIRDDGENQKHLDFWDRKFANCAVQYLLYRFSWVDYIHKERDTLSEALNPYDISYQYLSKFTRESTEENVLEQLHVFRERDIIVGHTTLGPHLDDFKFSIQHEGDLYDAADFLSRGENKLLLLMLKYLEIGFLEEHTGKKILLLFDDLFAELDEGRIVEVLEKFKNYQIIYTSQRTSDFLKKDRDFTCINLSLP